MFSLDVGLDGDDMVGGERGWLRAPNIGGRDPRCVTDENREPHLSNMRLNLLSIAWSIWTIAQVCTACAHNVGKHVYRPHS